MEQKTKEVCNNCTYYDPIKGHKGFLCDGLCLKKGNIKHRNNTACKKFSRGDKTQVEEG